jgi:hypothetical protein
MIKYISYQIAANNNYFKYNKLKDLKKYKVQIKINNIEN